MDYLTLYTPLSLPWYLFLKTICSTRYKSADSLRAQDNPQSVSSAFFLLLGSGRHSKANIRLRAHQIFQSVSGSRISIDSMGRYASRIRSLALQNVLLITFVGIHHACFVSSTEETVRMINSTSRTSINLTLVHRENHSKPPSDSDLRQNVLILNTVHMQVCCPRYLFRISLISLVHNGCLGNLFNCLLLFDVGWNHRKQVHL